MQIEKTLINDRWRVLKVSTKFRIPTTYNFAVICPWNLQTVSIVLSAYKQEFAAQWLKFKY